MRRLLFKCESICSTQFLILVCRIPNLHFISSVDDLKLPLCWCEMITCIFFNTLSYSFFFLSSGNVLIIRVSWLSVRSLHPCSAGNKHTKANFFFSFFFFLTWTEVFLLRFSNINSLITDCTHSEEVDASSMSVNEVIQSGPGGQGALQTGRRRALLKRATAECRH